MYQKFSVTEEYDNAGKIKYRIVITGNNLFIFFSLFELFFLNLNPDYPQIREPIYVKQRNSCPVVNTLTGMNMHNLHKMDDSGLFL